MKRTPMEVIKEAAQYVTTPSELSYKLSKIGYPNPVELAEWLIEEEKRLANEYDTPGAPQEFVWPGLGKVVEGINKDFEVHYYADGRLQSLRYRIQYTRYIYTVIEWHEKGGWRITGEN